MAGYIGSKASVVSSGTENKRVFDITTTTTSLTGLAYTPNQVNVFHNGVRLVDGTDFTATNGSTITLTTAAENGDQVVVIASSSFQISDTVSASAGGTFTGAVTFSGGVAGETSFTDVVEFNNTSHILIPRGTTAQRPASPTNGMIRFNTTLGYTEEYIDSDWAPLSNLFTAIGGTITTVSGYNYHTFTSSGDFTVVSGTADIEYLVVGGGGGAGGGSGAAGGAGGMRTGTLSLGPGTYTATIGAGGAGWTGTSPTAGQSTTFHTITSLGGGPPAASGGSGGGGAAGGVGGSGTAGQGNDGGTAVGVGTAGGGGGGKGAVGGAASANTGGNGGAGAEWPTSSGNYYAGGGGGGGASTGGSGGIGGGGAGGAASSTNGVAGTANTGGGSGSGWSIFNSDTQGGSGVVILRYQV